MPSEYEGKSVLVTGASRGIGRAVAERFRTDGAKVAITGRKADALATAVAELGGAPGVLGIAGKSDDADHRADVFAQLTDSFGGLDILVLNVGVNLAYGKLLDLDLGMARKIAEVNLVSTLGWLQAARDGLPGGLPTSVVIVASAAGIRPAENIGFYGATKAALIHLTAQLALELAPAVRVNAVAPAVVKTTFAQVLYEDEPATVAKYPVGRLGRPDDIAEAVAYLAGERAGWVTGQTLVLDGGLLLSGTV